MKVDVIYDICCSQCGKHASTDWDMGHFYSKKSCLNWAKGTGWKTKNGENWCVGCSIEERVIKQLAGVLDSIVYYADDNEFSIQISYDDGSIENKLRKIGLEASHFGRYKMIK